MEIFKSAVFPGQPKVESPKSGGKPSIIKSRDPAVSMSDPQCGPFFGVSTCTIGCVFTFFAGIACFYAEITDVFSLRQRNTKQEFGVRNQICRMHQSRKFSIQ